MRDPKIKQFQPEDWEGLPDNLEFWEPDDPSLPPDHQYKWVRTTGPSPEMFKWEYWEEWPVRRPMDEWKLEELREKALATGE
jgi:hypothetical protein